MGHRTRWGAIAASAVLALGLTACGGADNDDEGGGGDGASAGAPAKAPGFDGTTIKLATLSAQSGPVAVIGNPLVAGNKTWFDRLNAEGGVAGKYKVELVNEDNRYEADTTVQRYNRVKNDVTAVLQVLGTAPTLALLPQLRRDKIVAGPASLDGFWVKEPNLLPIGAPYEFEAANGLAHYIEAEGKDKTFCTFTQDDVYGEAALRGVDAEAKQAGIQVATRQKFKLADKDVTGQVQRLRRAGCDAVSLAATPTDAATIWGTAARLKFAPRWIAQAPAWTGAFAKSPLAPYLQQTTWVVAEGTQWGDESVPGMKQMIADQKQYAPKQQPDIYFQYGYNQGRAFTALLEKAVEKGDLSRDGLLAALNELGEVDYQGLIAPYTYGADGDRTPSRSNAIFSIDPKAPGGLKLEAKDVTSPAAQEIEFQAAP
ncbi:ABC transporter substrate-binding protein [Patulibacter brassicae]|uniref:ABC transporter substrate-binding protein n=1 Tax=Patulibacter brassicae TaxID=1705717 RepID=A0ABU4VI55_9ACTN|nr:ABC transporter substrate-binding protein [Patulibacter brassicae]MDX8151507.1 ABC transporter substrate-binding protein [Patulibacter brassicae]